MITMSQEQFEQIKRIVEAGPPPEPSAETPGPLVQALIAHEKDYERKHARKPPPEEYAAFLAFLLDRQRWEEESIAYMQMKNVVERKESAILRPTPGQVHGVKRRP